MQTVQLPPFVDLYEIVGRQAVTAEQAAENKRLNNGCPRRPKPEIHGLIPISRSTFLAGVRKGIYPQPVKFGRRTLWRGEDIRHLIENAVARP